VSEANRTSRVGTAILVVVIVALAIVIVQLLGSPADGDSDAATGTGTVAAIDAVAAYDAALQEGRPIYVLFHSRTCQSCIEIDAVAQVVVPEYEGRVSFVDVITDEDSSKELALRFPFQFIPTSYFLLPDGTVHSTYTGVLDAGAMRVQMDSLLAAD
jgi:thioredoxin-like negative regulator of GroEL